MMSAYLLLKLLASSIYDIAWRTRSTQLWVRKKVPFLQDFFDLSMINPVVIQNLAEILDVWCVDGPHDTRYSSRSRRPLVPNVFTTPSPEITHDHPPKAIREVVA